MMATETRHEATGGLIPESPWGTLGHVSGRIRRYPNLGYLVRTVWWEGNKDNPPTSGIREARTLDGRLYIGTPQDAWFLARRKGVRRFEGLRPDSTVASVGFAPAHAPAGVGIPDTGYGWSHRAICGFTVGSEVKQGDSAFRPSTAAEFREQMRRFWSSESTEVVLEEWLEDGYAAVKVIHGGLSHMERYPGQGGSTGEWGHGAWTAQTLEDAHQMARDFAEGVG